MMFGCWTYGTKRTSGMANELLLDVRRQKVGPVWLLVMMEVVPSGHSSQYVWLRSI